jgi:hypothetical protein
VLGLLALTLAAAFAGAAVYVSFAEQPARLALDDRAAVAQWQPSYARGAVMQGGLALRAALLGLAAAWQGSDWRWLVGAVLIGLAWPYTLLVVAPTNRRLNAISPQAGSPQAGPPQAGAAESRPLLQRWGRLHLLRAGLGAAASAAYLWPLA